MVFQLNHDDVFGNNIPDGEYEVFINSMRENVTPGGSEYAEADLIIRNDVGQERQNNHIFHKIWKAKATGEYSSKSFNVIAKAAQLPNGKTYETLDELFRDFEGRPVRVRIKNETSEYNGKTYENVNVKAWEKSRIDGPVRHVKKESATPNDGGLFSPTSYQIRDEDLPF